MIFVATQEFLKVLLMVLLKSSPLRWFLLDYRCNNLIGLREVVIQMDMLKAL